MRDWRLILTAPNSERRQPSSLRSSWPVLCWCLLGLLHLSFCSPKVTALHALSDVEEVGQAFGPGGAMETILKAKQDGKIRYIGFSAHSEEAAHAAMDHFDFDSLLFPLSFPNWFKTKFGPSVYTRAKEAGMGVIALKPMAHQMWPQGEERRWNKTFYEPFDDIDMAALGLRFTLHLPVTAMFPPGHWELSRWPSTWLRQGHWCH